MESAGNQPTNESIGVEGNGSTRSDDLHIAVLMFVSFVFMAALAIGVPLWAIQLNASPGL